MRDLFCFRRQNLESMGAQEKETLHIVIQLLPLCVCQISSKSNNFQRKKAGKEKNWSKQKAQTSRDVRPTLLLIKKSWVKEKVGQWDPACTLVNYLHYVSANFQPNRTNFRVKGLATKEVVKAKSTNFTRCSTYFASNDKYSGQRELKTLKLCMYLVTYFHKECAKNHPIYILEGKRASEAKSGDSKKHNVQELLNLLCFQWRKPRVKGNLRKWNFSCSYSITSTMCVPNFIQTEQFSA